MRERMWPVVILIAAVLLVPQIVWAAVGSFSSSSSTAAVTGKNTSSTGKGVYGVASSTSGSTHIGVYGNTSGAGGIGVYGTGSKYGVYSKGDLGILSGKALKCTGCIDGTDVGQLPAVRVTKSGTQTISNASPTTLTFDTETFDQGGLHSTSVNTDRLTAPIAGVYLVTVTLNYVANGTGSRWVLYYRNGSSYDEASSEGVEATYLSAVNSSVIVYLNAGDYMSVSAFQDSGGNLDIQTQYTNFSMTRLSG